ACGCDVLALVGALRLGEQRSVPESHRALRAGGLVVYASYSRIWPWMSESHRALRAGGLVVAERTVTHLVHRYEELLAVRLSDLGVGSPLRATLVTQGRVILAIDGRQPSMGGSPTSGTRSWGSCGMASRARSSWRAAC